MKIAQKESLSILALPVAPEVQRAKPKPIAKKYTPPPAPPCMATRQYNEAIRKAAEKRAKWAEGIRYDNLRTPYGAVIQALIDNPGLATWPKDW